MGDTDRETQADEEVGGRQVLQVDGDTAGRKETPKEVDPQRKAVEDQTDLQGGETGIITTTITRTTTKTITRTIITTTRTINICQGPAPYLVTSLLRNLLPLL